MLTEGVSNLRLDRLLTLIAITHENLRGLINLTRYPEQMRENMKRFDMKTHGMQDQDGRSALYSYPIPPAAESLWNRRG